MDILCVCATGVAALWATVKIGTWFFRLVGELAKIILGDGEDGH
jgi:hypothetical protein|nr:MAG TPA: hypothetical protein [Caudoviricetes sp.]